MNTELGNIVLGLFTPVPAERTRQGALYKSVLESQWD